MGCGCSDKKNEKADRVKEETRREERRLAYQAKVRELHAERDAERARIRR